MRISLCLPQSLFSQIIQIPIRVSLQKHVIPAVLYELLDFSTNETNDRSFPSNPNKQINIDKEQTGVPLKQKYANHTSLKYSLALIKLKWLS